MPSILIVDDESDILEATQTAFEVAGYDVLTASSAEEALPLIRDRRPQVLLIDYKLPKMSGGDLLREVRAFDRETPALLITGLTEKVEEVEAECRSLEIIGFLQKPLQIQNVLEMIRKALV